MDDTRTLGKLIHFRRAELGITQEALAERIGDGVRQSDVSRLERGRVSLPRRQRLEHIAAALDLPLGELLVRSGWSGAPAAFTDHASGATPEPVTTPTTAEPFRPSSPTSLPVVPPAAPRSPRLGEALARSQEVRARTAALLRKLRLDADATWGLSPSVDLVARRETRTAPTVASSVDDAIDRG